MYALFFSIAITTASIATGILFYLFPHSTISNGKEIMITTFTPTATPTVIIVSRSPSPIAPEEETLTSAQPSKFLSYELSPIPTLSNHYVTFSPSPLTITPIPTLGVTLLPKQIISSSPTISPTPLPTNTPSFTPTPTPTAIQSGSSQGLNGDIIFTMINNYRIKNNLPIFQKDDKTCTIAQQRATQIYGEIFSTGHLDAGLTTMNLPYWITEIIINDDTEQDAVDWWLQDIAHRQVILGNYNYSCTACSGYNCAQVFTNYISK